MKWKSCIVFVLFSPLASVADSRASGTISRSEVHQAILAELRSRGLSAAALPRIDNVELPASVPAAQGRELRVTGACWEQSSWRAQFRVECRAKGDCLPFLTYIPDFRSGGDGQALRACRAAQTSDRPRAASRKPVLHAGERATVLFSRGRLRLTAVVTCLERGAEGDVIRVRNQDGQIFRARIANGTMLEALAQ